MNINCGNYYSIHNVLQHEFGIEIMSADWNFVFVGNALTVKNDLILGPWVLSWISPGWNIADYFANFIVPSRIYLSKELTMIVHALRFWPPLSFLLVHKRGSIKIVTTFLNRVVSASNVWVRQVNLFKLSVLTCQKVSTLTQHLS